MSKVRDHLKKVPGVTWELVKEDWPTDRIVIGPFTTPKRDKQKDRVLLTSPRLDYIFKYGNLIWNHHGDPKEPVVVLGDCLAIGYDAMGKTYGAWGVKEGTETIDGHWQDIVKLDKKGGFSIGGKIPMGSRVCTGDGCVLTDPEVLEVSFTPRPANEEATVYYVNQFAKSMVETIDKEGPNTYEILTEFNRFDKKLESMIKSLPDDNYEVDRFVKYPCVDNIMLGFMEAGMKKDEAKLMVQTHIESLHKSLVGDKLTEQQDKTEKQEMAPAPQAPAPAGGNQTLEVLNAILTEMRMMNTKLDAQASMSAPPAEPPVGGGKEGKPEEGGKPKPESSEPPAEEKAEDKEKKQKTEKSLVETNNIPETSKEVADKPTGHTPDPAGSGSKVVGDNPELKPAVSEKPVPGETSEKVGSSIPNGASQGSPIKKDEIPVVVKRPEKGDVIKMLKDQGFVTFKVDTRPPVPEKHIISGEKVVKETPETKPKTITQLMREGKTVGLTTIKKPMKEVI